jgi:putative ABC transport system ATP-binding protein
MLRLENITKTYFAGAVETPVLRGVTFEAADGEFVAIMGASGTGKTTLMNILGCLDLPSGGTYLLDGVDVFRNSDDTLSAIRNQKIGFVFQQFHLLERASALDNVLLPLIYSDKYPSDAAERASEALRAVGLGERLQYPPGQLSGGQQQRVAIARALVTNPALILADEPTGNLDRRSGLEVMAILQRLNKEGRTVVLITHDLNIAEHAQRILTLRDGRIFEDAHPEFIRDAQAELESLPATSAPEGPALTQRGAR